MNCIQTRSWNHDALVFVNSALVRKIPFASRNYVTRELIKLEGVKQGIDINDEEIYARNFESQEIDTDYIENEDEPEETQTISSPTTTLLATTERPPPEIPFAFNIAGKILPSNDIAEAIAHILWQDFPANLLESPEKQTEALHFIQLIQYFESELNFQPMERYALDTITTYLKNQIFDYDEYMNAIRHFPEPATDYSDICRGSTQARRGWTCTLWRLFHTLTVFCDIDRSCTTVQDNIISFVLNFFGCTDCVENFKKEIIMFEPPRKSDPRASKKEIIWLWKLHNSVNARLSGDKTDDPMFPKRQFPTFEECEARGHRCYDHAGNYIENAVYRFLKVEYRPAEWEEVDERQHWPVGNYGFLKSKRLEYCPDGFYTWTWTQTLPGNSRQISDGDWKYYFKLRDLQSHQVRKYYRYTIRV